MVVESMIGILAELEAEMLVAYSAILVMALVPIWIGSHRSLEQKAVLQDPASASHYSFSSPSTETLSSKDAYMFPVIGSCVLFGLYLLFKFLSKEYVNMLLTAYFLVFGIVAVSSTLRPFLAPFFSPAVREREPYHLSFTPFWRKEAIEVKFTMVEFVSTFFGLIIGIWYVSTKHWISNNILGLSFSIQGVAFLSLGSYQTGCILLGGLFLYDIFWVFGTDVMVTVAKSFDAPIKLLFPKDIFAEEMQFSMLGLGDIVIPGIFIALLLRFDASRAGKKDNFARTHFITTFLGYIAGMVATIGVMHFFQAAQPALLYLVPSCIGSSLLAAAATGNLKQLINYSEEAPEEEQTTTTSTTTKDKKAPATKQD
ncbi:Minor histocompatibility antigen H13 [Balamuthia mandrillaris]